MAPQTAETLWEFAARVYASDAVRNACLELQDRHGAHVNLLLWAAWAAQRQDHALTPSEVEAARAATADWQRTVVAPLRKVRQGLKGHSAALYARAKSLELDMERVEIGMLADLPLVPRPAVPGTLAANLRLTAPPGAPDALLDALAGALPAATAQ